MKRNFDLMRDILIKIEDFSSYYVEGYEDREIYHNMRLLNNERLLSVDWTGTFLTAHVEEQEVPVDFKLTWDGHNFITVIRNHYSWKLIKAFIKTRNENVSLIDIYNFASGITDIDIATAYAEDKSPLRDIDNNPRKSVNE